MAVTTEELFLELYNSIRGGATIEDVCKNFGGSNIYIPSFKSLGRNDELIAEYDKRIKEGQDKSNILRELAIEYNLSLAHTYKIIKASKEQPSLF
jgi:Mor family transcriptional regulator